MAHIELVDEQISAIIIEDLKQAYTATMYEMVNGNEDDYSLLAGFQSVLKYYMGEHAFRSWLKQNKTWFYVPKQEQEDDIPF